jgi:hypothetical protein
MIAAALCAGNRRGPAKQGAADRVRAVFLRCLVNKGENDWLA